MPQDSSTKAGARVVMGTYNAGVNETRGGSPAVQPTLCRAVGRWDLTALGINQVIGGGIFLVPAPLAALLGTWSPVGFVLAGLAMLLVALCYAETGSRFRETGGAYLYARAAFGGFIGFEVGWMQWFVRVSSQAAIVSGIASTLIYLGGAANSSWAKTLVVVPLTLLAGYLHSKGIRDSALAIRFFTAGKLVPLLIFIGAGLFLIDWRPLWQFPAVSAEQALGAGLMLMFAYGGFETVPVLAGEAKNPGRDLVYALVATILCVTAVMSLTQLVYVASSQGIASTEAPLTGSARILLGWAGAAVISTGSLISMYGSNLGSSLAASRLLFAFAERGDAPKVFANIHSRYRTPAVAIWFSTAVAILLAVSGSFALLAGVSALARLVTYTAVSVATLTLRSSGHPPAAFVLPFGAVIPVAATAVSLATAVGASGDQLKAGALALAAGAVVYVCNDWNRARIDRLEAEQAQEAG
jgi:basic amino acid/polyamine antiporter, APA family